VALAGRRVRRDGDHRFERFELVELEVRALDEHAAQEAQVLGRELERGAVDTEIAQRFVRQPPARLTLDGANDGLALRADACGRSPAERQVRSPAHGEARDELGEPARRFEHRDRVTTVHRRRYDGPRRSEVDSEAHAAEAAWPGQRAATIYSA